MNIVTGSPTSPETTTLGKCCICEIEGPQVHNIVMLDIRSPEPGNGCWGCLVCGLPQEGAIAVLCDECLKTDANLKRNFKRIKFVCLGYPSENRRIERALLKEAAFEHDEAKHEDEENYKKYPDWPRPGED